MEIIWMQYENVSMFAVLNIFHTQKTKVMETVFFSVVALLIVAAVLLSRGLQSPDQISKY
jgi:hypothetical protein